MVILLFRCVNEAEEIGYKFHNSYCSSFFVNRYLILRMSGVSGKSMGLIT